MPTKRSMLPSPRPRVRHLRWAALLVTILVAQLALVLGPIGLPHNELTPTAVAANCVGSISDLAWKRGDIKDGVFYSQSNGLAQVQFSWKIDDGARAGDTFTLTVPPELAIYLGSEQFSLYDGTEEVAKGVFDGNVGTFTLTNYVNTHSAVSGTAHFTVRWDEATPKDHDYDLAFNSCRGPVGTLPGHLLPDPPSGNFQQNFKLEGFIWEEQKSVYWDITLATPTKGDHYQPVVIKDPAGVGYSLSCDGISLVDRTPGPTYLFDPDGGKTLGDERFECKSDGAKGIILSLKPDEFGRYIRFKESLMFSFHGPVQPSYKDMENLDNTATITGSPDGDATVQNVAPVPGAGGAGAGKQTSFTITKDVAGDVPAAGGQYTFEYQCAGDDFTAFEPIAAGGTTSVALTRATTICTIREKNMPAGAQVDYAVMNPESGATITDLGGGTVKLSFAPDGAPAKLKATNTFTKPSFAVEKTTTDAPAEISSSTTSLTRTYEVKVTNKGQSTAVSNAVTDTPSTPEGMTITKVLVDGAPVALSSASFPITAGDNLSAGASKTHNVQITYAVAPTQITEAGIRALTTCAATGTSPDPTKGIYNVVQMDGDVDGVDNNDVCTTAVDKRGSLSWSKVDDAGAKQGGSTWTLTGAGVPADTVVADCELAPCAAGDFKDTDPAAGQFKVTGLAWGSYSIREEQPPTGFERLTDTLDFPEITSAALDGVLADVAEKVEGGGVINHRITGSVAWQKIDGDNHKPLAGATWKLSGPQVPEGTEVADCEAAPCAPGVYADTDPEPGTYRLEGLGIGKYSLVEASAPAGYRLDPTERSFELTADALNFQFTEAFPNRKTTVPALPLTGGLGADWFLLAGGGIAGVAAFAALATARHRRRALA